VGRVTDTTIGKITTLLKENHEFVSSFMNINDDNSEFKQLFSAALRKAVKDGTYL